VQAVTSDLHGGPNGEVPPNSVLRDRYGRTVTYLRVSITDRCNLRCFYCLPRGFCQPRREQLSFDELHEVVSVAVGLGIRKIRLTGGEPLVRRGVVEFIRRLRTLPGVAELALSTNGTLLAEHAAALHEAGLARVNVSLDSLRRSVLRAISGVDHLDRVVDGIEAASAAGLRPLKLNVVVIRGVNDDELPALLEFASRHGAQTRFIEYMPLGGSARWHSSFVSRAEILGRIESFLVGGPPRHQPGDTATYYLLREGGEVGIISPVSCRFCDLCNRLRLTADGRLRPCLTSKGEVDLRDALRPMVSPGALADGFRTATAGRPQSGQYHGIESLETSVPRPMVAIGG
jgi:cyclic pyranopterin phosphate synthase